MSTAVAISDDTQRVPAPVAINRTEYEIMRAQAADLIASGYLPKAIDKPEKAVAIIMLGRELGMGPWQSFNSIDVIQGRPTLKPIGMAALVNRFVEARGGYLCVVESTAERCVVEYLRPPAPAPRQVSFTKAEATTAGLMGKDTWRQYPVDMLRSRAISRACREGFSDVILGLYSGEEVESMVSVHHPSGARTATVTAIHTEPPSTDSTDAQGRRSSEPALSLPKGQADEDMADVSWKVEDEPKPAQAILDESDEDEGEDWSEHGEARFDERTQANRRYHGIAASHGWSEAARKLLALSQYPYHDGVRTTSRTQLTVEELRALGTLMEDEIGREVDLTTGVIIPTPDVEQANKIAIAPDQRTLAEIAAKLKSDGIAAPWLKKMWAYRNREVPAHSASLLNAEEGPDGEAGADRFTA